MRSRAIAASKPSTWLPPAVLDRVEQVAIVLLWLWLVERVALSFFRGGNHLTWLVLLSETPVMVFTVIRRPTSTISTNMRDWLLAIVGTAAPMLIQTVNGPTGRLGMVGVALVMAGTLGEAVAKLVLARSFGIAAANRGIKMSGPYRVVRHPIYASYLIIHIGVVLMMPLPINLLLYAIGWSAQIRRILVEEALLSQDAAYRAYMARVVWRLIPGIF